jgi:hypothetical protein
MKLSDFGGMFSAANLFTTGLGVLSAPVVTILAPAYATTALTTYAVIHGAQHAIDTFIELEAQNGDDSLSGSAYSVAQALTQGVVIAAVDLTLMDAFVAAVPAELVNTMIVGVSGLFSTSNVEKGYESMHSGYESMHSGYESMHSGYKAVSSFYESLLTFGQDLYGQLEDYYNAI